MEGGGKREGEENQVSGNPPIHHWNIHVKVICDFEENNIRVLS